MAGNNLHLDTTELGNRSGSLPFFAARHKGRAVAIRRNSDYDVRPIHQNHH